MITTITFFLIQFIPQYELIDVTPSQNVSDAFANDIGLTGYLVGEFDGNLNGKRYGFTAWPDVQNNNYTTTNLPSTIFPQHATATAVVDGVPRVVGWVGVLPNSAASGFYWDVPISGFQLLSNFNSSQLELPQVWSVNSQGFLVGIFFRNLGAYPKAFIYRPNSNSPYNWPEFNSTYNASNGYDLNHQANIIGVLSNGPTTNQAATLWTDETKVGRTASPLDPALPLSKALAINSSNKIVGWSSKFDSLGNTQKRPCLWNSLGVPIDLFASQTNLTNFEEGEALDISDSLAHNGTGTVVGFGYEGGQKFAFIWTEAKGLFNLNDLILSPPYIIEEATGINSLGEISATADLAGFKRAVILKPILSSSDLVLSRLNSPYASTAHTATIAALSGQAGSNIALRASLSNTSSTVSCGTTPLLLDVGAAIPMYSGGDPAAISDFQGRTSFNIQIPGSLFQGTIYFQAYDCLNQTTSNVIQELIQ